MRVSSPSPAELLQAWERGVGRSITTRALLLLVAACPDASPHALAQLSIGRRDGVLLSLREALFGPHLACMADCPRCNERLELSLLVADMRAEPPRFLGGGASLALQVEGYDIEFRLPNSEDVLELEARQVRDVGAAKAALFARCVLSVRRNDEMVDVDALPPEAVNDVGARMAASDPQADTRLSLTCPGCGHAWLTRFDIASFVWAEVDDWARRTLRDVHVLASAYGWREGDILGLSTARRQMYLDMVRE